MSNNITLTVRGHKVHSASRRRYLVVTVQPNDYETTTQRYRNGEWVSEPITVPAGARVHKRSDNIDTARKCASSFGYRRGGLYAVVVDTVTGQEVS